MQNVKFKTTTNLPINQVIANVFNGKTPTGTDWTLAYDGGYLQYEGVVKTYGDFQWDRIINNMLAQEQIRH